MERWSQPAHRSVQQGRSSSGAWMTQRVWSAISHAMGVDSVHTPSWKFWVVAIVLGLLVVVCLFGAWGYLIAEGLGVAGVNRPSYWGIFLVNTVFWIGIMR